ncbi:polyprenyl synthetase family protein [Clostridium sp. 19966]|uniref:polyprenyl synthetase family protein n=1 Tax=Clostridium sp. 19966 TaxID=2768166 RepID=UPI0028DE978F|nr:polyprenyl synthetase family protein [Clostridium sp. 19966]MDT8718619.1 polyprenyl synthetase family protein [Clostridium sp. 19966]
MLNFIEVNNLIREELNEVQYILKDIGDDFNSSSKEIFDFFFNTHGKYLRPILTILSAKAIKPNMTTEQRVQLINLCVAIELIHSASLVHDDIIDNDLLRRGQKTLNSVYGRKIAVLAGDTLFAKAFSILSSMPSKESQVIMTRVVEKMCIAEIEQAHNCEVSKEDYLRIIEGKTAVFMSACCKIGALVVNAEKQQISSLEQYGLNLGMVYQITDDCIDDDYNSIKNNITIEKSKEFVIQAEECIKSLEESIYKDGLVSFLNYVIDSYNPKIKKA